MRETWYVLEDGTTADPAEVGHDDRGMLRHQGGVAVAMRGDAHSSRSVDPDEERAKAKAKPKAKDMISEPEPAPSRPGYKTREARSR